MVRLLVQFTEAQLMTLRLEARRQKKAVAALVRESVSSHLAQIAQTADGDKWERAKHAPGGFRSGVTDLAEHHDKYLARSKSW